MDHYRVQCGWEPYIRINMRGRIVQYVKPCESSPATSYTFCPSCGQKAEWGISKWGVNGWTCGRCDEEERKAFQLPLCAGCERACSVNDKSTSKWTVVDDDSESYLVRTVYLCETCTGKAKDLDRRELVLISELLNTRHNSKLMKLLRTRNSESSARCLVAYTPKKRKV